MLFQIEVRIVCECIPFFISSYWSDFSNSNRKRCEKAWSKFLATTKADFNKLEQQGIFDGKVSVSARQRLRKQSTIIH